ncbi:hypothetical protein LSAT2_025718 [Lamellibrachia satsuma]|nr:hypothetical protein LSAT2_025718 [Lamellibrachia satsuma]
MKTVLWYLYKGGSKADKNVAARRRLLRSLTVGQRAGTAGTSPTSTKPGQTPPTGESYQLHRLKRRHTSVTSLVVWWRGVLCSVRASNTGFGTENGWHELKSAVNQLAQRVGLHSLQLPSPSTNETVPVKQKRFSYYLLLCDCHQWTVDSFVDCHQWTVDSFVDYHQGPWTRS